MQITNISTGAIYVKMTKCVVVYTNIVIYVIEIKDIISNYDILL